LYILNLADFDLLADDDRLRLRFASS